MPIRESKSDAVVLLSGGLDSATVLAIAMDEGRRCHALAFDYGQRHAMEVRRAADIAGALGADSFRTAEIDPRIFGDAALLSAGAPIPKDGSADVCPDGPAPSTYVPARNLIFLSHALALAEVLAAREIWIGVNSVDYGGYPDCRPEFIDSFEKTANFATAAGAGGQTRFRIRAPLQTLGKGEIIRKGLSLGVNYALTLSCYDPDPAGRACGRCNACRVRLRGFGDAGVADPAPYQPVEKGRIGAANKKARERQG